MKASNQPSVSPLSTPRARGRDRLRGRESRICFRRPVTRPTQTPMNWSALNSPSPWQCGPPSTSRTRLESMDLSEDIALRQGRVLADKAPGLSLAAIPVVWISRVLLAEIPGTDLPQYWPLRHFATGLLVSLGTALFCFFIAAGVPEFRIVIGSLSLSSPPSRHPSGPTAPSSSVTHPRRSSSPSPGSSSFDRSRRSARFLIGPHSREASWRDSPSSPNTPPCSWSRWSSPPFSSAAPLGSGWRWCVAVLPSGCCRA